MALDLQSLQEVHWRQAQEGMLPGEGYAEECCGAQASAVEPDQHNKGAAAAHSAYASGHGHEGPESAGWGAGNAATPWSDWAAVEGPSRAENHAGAAFAGYYGTEADRVAGRSAYEPEAGRSAPSSVTGQWSPAELAAQAKAWADWAAGQTQSCVPPYSQVSGCAHSAAAAQPADARTVSIPVSMYKRYQELEWAEWRRQYEGWQKHMAEWQKQYVHWYGAYMSWYSQFGSAAVQ